MLLIAGNRCIYVLATAVGSNNTSPIASWQYSIDGQVTWVDTNSVQIPFCITGLNNNQQYTVVIRGKYANGTFSTASTTYLTYNKATPFVTPFPDASYSVLTVNGASAVTFDPSSIYYLNQSVGGHRLGNLLYYLPEATSSYVLLPNLTPSLFQSGSVSIHMRLSFQSTSASNMTWFSAKNSLTQNSATDFNSLVLSFATTAVWTYAQKVANSTLINATGASNVNLVTTGNRYVQLGSTTMVGTTAFQYNNGSTYPALPATQKVLPFPYLSNNLGTPYDIFMVFNYASATISLYVAGYGASFLNSTLTDFNFVESVSDTYNPATAFQNCSIFSIGLPSSGGPTANTGMVIHKVGVYTSVLSTTDMASINSSDNVHRPVPSAPVFSGAPVVSGTQVSLPFTAPYALASAPVTGYYYSVNGGTPVAVASSPAVVTGLTAGTVYTIRLYAANRWGNGDPATLSNFTIAGSLFAAPTINTVATGNGLATVAFTTTMTSVTGVLYSLNGGAFYAASTSTSPITITGLTNGTSYTVRLQVVNVAQGTSSASVASSSFTPVAPAAPVIASATPGNGTATVAFTTAMTSVTAITYQLNPGGTLLTAFGTTSPITISGLTNGTAYTVQLQTRNDASGASLLSTASSSFTPALFAAPTLGTTTAGNASVVVSFTTTMTNVVAVQYALNGSTTYVTAAGTTSPLTITGLNNGTSYTVKLQTVNVANGVSSASSASAAVTPALFAAPTLGTVIPANTSMVVPFTTTMTNLVCVQYALNGSTTFVNASTTTSPLTITGLTNGTSYSVQLQTVNVANGTSAVSSASTAVTPYTIPAAPVVTSVVQGTAVGTMSVNMTPSTTTTLPVLSYKYTLSTGPTATYSLPHSNVNTDSSANHVLTLAGLTEGTSYTVTVQVTTANGTSASSNTSAPFVPWSAMTGFAAPTSYTSAYGSVTFPVVAPSALHGNTVTGYQYSVSGDAGPWLPGIVTTNVAGTTVTVYNLTLGATYAAIYLQAVSANTVSNAVLCPTVVVSSVLLAPIVQSVAVGPTVGAGTAVVAFVNATTGPPVLQYTYTLNTGATATYTLPHANVDTSNGLLTITGLTNGTSYTVSLQSATAVTTSPFSAPSSAFVPFGNMTGLSVASTYASAFGSLTFTVTPPTALNGCTIDRYQYCVSGSPQILLPATWVTATTVSVYGLTNGQAYSLSLQAVATNGAVSNLAACPANAIVTVAPGAPVLLGTTVSSATVRIRFVPGDAVGQTVTAYTYSLVNTTTQSTVQQTYTLTSRYVDLSNGTLDISGLVNGTSYIVSLQAQLSDNTTSSASNALPFTPAGDMTGLAVASSVDIDHHTLTFAVTPPTALHGSLVTGYRYALTSSSPSISWQPCALNADSTVTVYGLDNGTTYTTIVLQAVDIVHDTVSNIVTCPPATVYEVPDPPVMTEVQAGNAKVTVDFVDGETFDQTISGYAYRTRVTAGTATEWTPFSGNSGRVVIDGLANGTAYEVQLLTKVNNDAHTSTFSPWSLPVTPFTTPAPPSNVVVTASDESLYIVSLTPPAAATIVGYHAAFSHDGSFSLLPYSDVTTLPWQVAGLRNGTAYTLSVRALADTDLVSTWVDASQALVPYTLPSAPTITAATAVDVSFLQVSVTDGSSNGAATTGYWYAVCENNATDVSFTFSPVPGSGSPLRLPLSRVVIGTTVMLLVKQENQAGVSPASLPFLYSRVGTPSAPQAFTVVTRSQEVLLYTSGIASNGAAVTALAYSLDGGVTYQTAQPAQLVALPNAVLDRIYVVTIVNLTNDVSYGQVYVRAQNSEGWGPAALAPTLYPRGVPDAPVITSVQAMDRMARLTVIDGSNNGAPSLGYEYSLDNGNKWVDALQSTSPLTVFDLSNGTSYRVMVRSINIMGPSSSSARSAPFMPNGISDAPVITEIQPGIGSAVVSFSPIQTNGGTLTKLQYRTAAGTVIDLSGLTSPVTIPDLTNKNTYTIGLFANTSAGQSALSNTMSVTVGAPTQPRIVRVATAPNSIALTFVPSAPNASAVIKYTVTAVGGGMTPWNILPSLLPLPDASGYYTATVPGLVNGVTYTLVLTATNASGMSPPSNATFAAMPLDAPSVPGIKSAKAVFQAAELTVTPPNTTNGSPILKYQYLLATASAPAGTWTDVSSSLGELNMVVPAPNNQPYTVSVRAVNSYGASPASPATASLLYRYLPPDTMKAPTLVAIYNAVRVTFVAPLANGAPITDYYYALNGSTTYQSLGSTVSPATITRDVSYNVPYTIRMYAVNSAGDGLPSPPSVVGKSTLYPYTPPTTGPVLTSIYPTDRSLVVSFTPPPIVNARILRYQAVLGGSASLVDVSYNVDGSGNVLSPVTINGLTNGTAYVVALQAVTAVGNSPSSTRTITATPVYGVPAAPILSSVKPSTLNANTLTAVFTYGASNGAPLLNTQYTFDGSQTIVEFGSVPTSPWSIPCATIPTTFAMRVRNVNGWSAWTYTPLPLKSVPLPVVTSTFGQLRVTVPALATFPSLFVPGAPVLGYQYQLVDFVTKAVVATEPVSFVSPTSSLFTIDVSNNVHYAVQIAAVNAAGISAFSSLPKTGTQYIFVPPKTAPTNITFAYGSQNSVTVRAVAPVVAGTTNAPVTGYVGHFIPSGAIDASFDLVSSLNADGISVTFAHESLLENDHNYGLTLAAATPVGNATVFSKYPIVVTPVWKATGTPIMGYVRLNVVDATLLDVSFTNGPQNGSAIDAYQYTLDGGATVVDLSYVTSPVSLPGFGITGLPPYFAMRAHNAAGWSAWNFQRPAAITAATAVARLNAVDVSFALPAPTAPYLPGAPITSLVYFVNGNVGGKQSTSTLTSPLAVTDDVSYNTSYTVSLAAVNAGGPGVILNMKPTKYIYLPPRTAPTLVSAVGSNHRLDLSFTAPSIVGTNAAITGYSVVLNGVSNEPLLVLSATSPLAVEGLVNDSSYTIAIAAVTPVGLSPYSNRIVGTPVWSVPAAPVVTLWELSNNVVKATFTVSTAWTGSVLQGYQLSFDGGATFVDVSSSNTTSNNVKQVTGTINNNTINNTTLYAVNGAGRSLPSSAVSLLGPNVVGPTVAPAVTVTVAKVLSSYTATIRVQVASSSSSSLTGYRYLYGISGETLPTTFTAVTGLATTTTLSNLALGTTYRLLVQTTNSAGSSPSASALVVVPNT